MKKFLRHILILIALIGIFNFIPAKQAHATSDYDVNGALGTCTLQYGPPMHWTWNTCFGTSNGQNWTEDTGTCIISNIDYNKCAGWANTNNPNPFSGDHSKPGTCTLTGWKDSSCHDKGPGAFTPVFSGTPPTAGSLPTGSCYVGHMLDSSCTKYGGTPTNSQCLFTNKTQYDCLQPTSSWWNTFISDFNAGTIIRGDITTTWYPNGSAPGKVAQQNITSYTLLAPLPDTKGGQLTTLDVTGTNSLGNYLNIILSLFIGICGVLAVIMILMGGIEYMTSELISGKEAGKERIEHAIFGLILALSSWLLLNTINPNLLKTDFSSLAPVAANIQLQDETETADSAVTTDGGAPSGPTAGCPSGIGKTAGGISVCNSIVSSVNSMITAATAAGINLTGGGYRSMDSQTALRVAHCNGNTTDRSATCTPPTAIPGASRHQQGLAIDFKCDGVLIRDKTNKCYVWLASNASKYGLSNLASEPWHWSTDGR